MQSSSLVHSGQARTGTRPVTREPDSHLTPFLTEHTPIRARIGQVGGVPRPTIHPGAWRPLPAMPGWFRGLPCFAHAGGAASGRADAMNRGIRGSVKRLTADVFGPGQRKLKERRVFAEAWLMKSEPDAAMRANHRLNASPIARPHNEKDQTRAPGLFVSARDGRGLAMPRLTRPRRLSAAPAASDRSDTARTCARSPTRRRPPC